MFDFTVSLCHRHHVTITSGLRNLGIDTSAKATDLKDAIRATMYFLWILLDHYLGGEEQ